MNFQEKNIKWVTLAVLIASGAMIAAGAARGEPDIVLAKAIRICMQCIGIG